MKKSIFAYAFLIFALFSCAGEQKAFISGESELFNAGDSLYFSNRPLEDFPITQLFTYKTVVDENKHFQIQIPLKKAGFVSLSSGLTFYASPKDSVHFVIEAQAKVTYSGKYANLNNALVNFKMGEATILSPIFEKYFSQETGRLNYEIALIDELDAAFEQKREELVQEHSLDAKEAELLKAALQGYHKRISFIASLYIPKEIFDTLSEEEKKRLTDIEVSIAAAEHFPGFLTTLYLKMIENDIRNNQMSNIVTEDIDKKIAGFNLTKEMKDDLYAYAFIMLLNQMSAGSLDAERFDKNSQAVDLLLSRIKNETTRKSLEDIWKEASAYFNPNTPSDLPGAAGARLAPSIELEDEQGKSFALTQFAGKVVYIDFWATWCAPCLEQIPALKKVQQRYKDNKEVVFLSISVDRQEDKAKWKQTIAQHKMPGLHAFAGDDNTGIGIESHQFDVSVVPSFYLVSKTGELLVAAGPSSENELIAMIDGLLQ